MRISDSLFIVSSVSSPVSSTSQVSSISVLSGICFAGHARFPLVLYVTHCQVILRGVPRPLVWVLLL